jgi:hypothetical protein
MTDPGKLIADALREIGEQATKPRLRIDTVWQAGRRRRMRARAASAIGAAGVAAAAVLLPLALTSGPAHPGSGPAAGSRSPILLASPIQFRQVAAITHRPCQAGPQRVPGTSPTLCFHLTKTGMTVIGVESLQVMHFTNNRYSASTYALKIRFLSADSRSFAALTRHLAGLPYPRRQVAVIVHGRVVFYATVQGPVTSGQTFLTAGATQAQAEHLLKELKG